MSSPYIGEIRLFGGNFAPQGWSFCNGQLIAISQNETLFNLIGTTFGGDGVQTFGLPDLQGRVPIHMGTDTFGNYVLGDKAGAETVTLTTSQIPVHSHVPRAATIADSVSPSGKIWSTDPSATVAPYNTAPTANMSMNANAIGSTGGSQAHDNMQPFLAISYIISLFGIYPSQT
jgi:microcystin-dependent protein